MSTILFIFYLSDSYYDSVREVYNALPYYYALDYLHLFYLKQIIFKAFLSIQTEAVMSVAKPLVIALPLNVLYSFIITK